MSKNKKEDVNKKNFNFWILLNWKTEDIKTYKLKPKDDKVGPYHIPVEIDIDVEIPDKPDVKAKGKIELGQDKIDEMVIESI